MPFETAQSGLAAPAATSPQPDAFFETVYQEFQRIEHRLGGLIDRGYSIGGVPIRMRFAGPALLPYLTPAIEHLAVQFDPAEPQLTICVCDSRSSDIALPPRPWSDEDCLPRSEIRGFNTDHLRTAFQNDAGVLSLIDLERGLAIYWVRDPAEIPYYECGAPLRAIFNWWLTTRARQIIHAGAVGTSQGGVIFAGKGGSGKSNTSLACLAAGLGYAGDDYCILTADPTPTIFSLYNTGKTHAADLARLPFLEAVVSNRDRLGAEKALYFLHQYFPEKLIESFPLRAILIPKITQQAETYMQATTAAAGLIALAPYTLSLLPGAGHGMHRIIAQTIRQVPCYDLLLGLDRARVAEVVREFLAHLNQPA